MGARTRTFYLYYMYPFFTNDVGAIRVANRAPARLRISEMCLFIEVHWATTTTSASKNAKLLQRFIARLAFGH